MTTSLPFKSAALFATLALLAASQTRAADPSPIPSPPAILQNLKSFQQFASVLMIAAHPDDENTQLIAYLARGREYRMAYLSVTRGDGGQNLLGSEFSEELGLIRTHELLAARNLDSGRQFFTRAIDFGFSKNPDETLKIWDRKAVLGDVVRIIRTFRPDVIVTRFSPTGTNTHGHHTSSAILGVEAFKLAGNSDNYPEQLSDGLTAWQPKRILLNGGGPGRGGGGGAGNVTIDAGGIDPVLNESYGSIANRSRAMHKSQGFGQIGGGGGRGGGGGAAAPSPQSFSLLAGDPATTDIMDGIDTTWARIPNGGADIAKLADDAIAKFNPSEPSASVPALLAIKAKAAALANDPIVTEKRQLLDRIIADCLGLFVETTLPNAEVTPGESLKLHHIATITSSVPVRWLDSSYRFAKADAAPIVLKANSPVSRDQALTLPAETPVTQPYWLREEPDPGIYHVSDPSLIGLPMAPPVCPIEHHFEVAGQTIVLPDQPVQIIPNAPAPQARRPLDVIAAVSVAFPFEVRLFSPGASKTVDVQVTAYRANAAGTLQLEAPVGWKVEPASQPFKFSALGDHTKLSFTVTPPAQPASATLSARATVNGQTYTTSRKEIRYDHIPLLLLQPPALLNALAVNVATKGKTIGYLPGAGDSVSQCIEQMGYTVKELKGSDLTPDTLKSLDAIVIGVRAFNTRDDLIPNLKTLFDYVNNGGTIIEQYNRPDQLRNNTLAPYPLHLSSLRVTDENATITFLAPDHPVLNTPNKITSADFENWVQERSIYLPDTWDEHFTPILAANDPGETPPNSALLIAQHGKGYFVYTSLVFFRQLPAANPGAYRLFANMLSLGK